MGELALGRFGDWEWSDRLLAWRRGAAGGAVLVEAVDAAALNVRLCSVGVRLGLTAMLFAATNPRNNSC